MKNTKNDLFLTSIREGMLGIGRSKKKEVPSKKVKRPELDLSRQELTVFRSVVGDHVTVRRK